MLKIKNKNTQLTDDQSIVIEQLVKFINSDKKIISLAGPAGSGKTFLLRYFLDNYYDKSVIVSAPTHKSLRVVENSTMRKGTTLHSLHALRPNLNLSTFDIANPQFDPLGEASINNYSLIIIDEAGQIPKGLIQLTKDRISQSDTKVIFVGDPYQLPPIKETSSKVFHEPTILLNKVIRQNNTNSLNKLFDLIRNDIDSGNNTFEQYIGKNLKNYNKELDEGYFCVNKKLFSELSTTIFNSKSFKSNVNYCRCTGFTNNSISNFNYHIRNNIVNSDDIIEIGDLTTAYSTIVDEFNDPIIVNSEDYRIIDKYDYIDEFGIKSFICNFEEIYSGKVTSNLKIIDHKDKKNFDRFTAYLNALFNNAINSSRRDRGKMWKKYYIFKDDYITFVNYNVGGREIKKDMDYIYGLTGHKIQGSTYNNMLINLHDILYNKYGKRYANKNLTRRLIYVALSRAINKSIIYI